MIRLPIIKKTTGDQTYRVKYGYDYARRMETMSTYRTDTATATWIYNEATGLLDRKEYQGGDGTGYTYTNAGRLETRTWQRGVVTTYHYDSGGRQWAIDYSDSTPDVLFALDSLGRITHEAQGALAVTNGVPSMASPIRSINHTHDPATLLPESETHHLGGLTRTLVRTHDAYGRPQVVAAGIDSDNTPATLETIDHFTEFFFGNDGRLLGIHAKDLPPLNQKDYGIEYTYTAQSAHLIHTITRAGSGSAANLVTTHTWDPTRDVLFVKDNRLDGDAIPVSQFDYTVNLLGQREKVETAGTAFGEADRGWTWGYDNLGQVTGATHTANSELDRSYLFDGIGNRLESTVGDTTVVTTEYDPNPLNQYSSITVGLNNPLAPIHDLDGNLTEDATHNHADEDRQYVWDAENRLIAVNKVTARTNGVITGTSTLVTYAYDSRSRRISRSVGVSPTSTTWYLYDGWNVVAEYTGATPALARTYTWGTDLSGSLQGAGGVGGLLAVRVHGGEYPGNYYPTFDGNGNVSEYLTTTGVIAAHFEYDPFGNLTAFSEEEEEQAAEFTYRFSTKPLDPVTGWFYYGYRWYDPVTGRWPSRDPIGKEGGINLYGFVGNDGVNWADVLGLKVEKRNCTWMIFFGHGVRPSTDAYIDSEGMWVPYETPISQLFQKFIDNPRKLPCGNRVGFVGCRRKTMNEQLLYGVKGNNDDLIPGTETDNDDFLRYDIGHPQRDEDTDNSMPHGHTELKRLWDKAISEAQIEVNGGESCCKTITISVECLGADEIPSRFGNRIPEPNCESERIIRKQ